MPRPKTRSDEEILGLALQQMQEGGPEALTFAALAARSGLATATLVQRFGSKDGLKRSALQLAWSMLEAETARLAGTLPKTPDGAISLLIGLSGAYGGIEAYAEGLLILREDLRDPTLRARGAAWKDMLCQSLDTCLDQSDVLRGKGLLLATHWQGSLLWWSFDPAISVEAHVESSLRDFIVVLGRTGTAS